MCPADSGAQPLACIAGPRFSIHMHAQRILNESVTFTICYPLHHIEEYLSVVNSHTYPQHCL